MSPGRSSKRSRLSDVFVSGSTEVKAWKVGGGGSKVTDRSEFGVTVKPFLTNNFSQTDFDQSMDSGTVPHLPSAGTSKATQVCSVLGQKSASSQTLPRKIFNSEVGIQAFEEDPWQYLLSEDEVCDLIQIDQLVGLGGSSRPEARLDDHSITCKRVLSKGIIYQVVVLREQYIVEKEIVKEIEVPRKEEKVVEKVTVEKDQKVKKTVEVEIIELDLDQDKPEEEASKVEDSKDILVIKEEKVIEIDKVEIVEDLTSFREKPWVNLRKKIVEKQQRQSPVLVPDNRTPYQRLTEEPQSPGPAPLEINSHIQLALQDIEEFLHSKASATQGFLPLCLSRKVMEQYRTYIEPGFALDPELAVQLEGLLAGVAFSGVNKRSVAFSTSELEKLSLTAFNIIEIVSFMMAAIAVVDGGLQKVVDKSKGTALSTLLEYKPFLGSLDKACRHVVKESLAIMSSGMMKQRHALASCLSFSLPKSFKAKIIKAPLTSFEVAPKEALMEVKTQYEGFVQRKAFAQAIANVGASRFKGTTRIVKKKTMVVARGTRARGQLFRGSLLGRSFRGQNRGSLRGVRRAGLSFRNMRAFARRDRAMGRIQDNQRVREPNPETAGQTGQSQQ